MIYTMRNSNGFGSIVCLDKTGKKRRKPWAVRITTGWKGAKQVRKYVGYYRTQTEALIALAEFHKNGIDLDLSKLTLGELWDRYLERVESRNLSASTLRMYKSTHDKLGDLLKKPIADIKLDHLQRWMDGIELKPATKVRLKNTLAQVFEYALKNDIITKNYAKFIEINEKIEKTGNIFSDEEIKQLWMNSNDEDVQRILILMYTGMRIGELLAVHRDHINFEESYIIGGSKTEAGRNRIIPIHDKIMPMIKQQIDGQNWLVQSRRGLPMNYTTASTKFHDICDKLNLGKHKIHDTRKTAVSLMHSAGIPMETIRVIVGHSGKGVTEQVYLYKTPQELVEAINEVEVPNF